MNTIIMIIINITIIITFTTIITTITASTTTTVIPVPRIWPSTIAQLLPKPLPQWTPRRILCISLRVREPHSGNLLSIFLSLLHSSLIFGIRACQSSYAQWSYREHRAATVNRLSPSINYEKSQQWPNKSKHKLKGTIQAEILWCHKSCCRNSRFLHKFTRVFKRAPLKRRVNQ